MQQQTISNKPTNNQ